MDVRCDDQARSRKSDLELAEDPCCRERLDSEKKGVRAHRCLAGAAAGLPGPERQYVPSRAFFARFPRGFAVYTRGHLHCRIDGKNQDRMREKVTIACQEFHRTLMHVLAYGPALNPGCVRRRTDASSGSRHHSPRRAQRRRNFRFRVGPSPDGVIQWLARTPGRQPQSSRRSE